MDVDKEKTKIKKWKEKAASSRGDYRSYVKEKIDALKPIFARVAVGDFSKQVDLPAEDDEFLELYAGIDIMLDIIRDKLADLEQSNIVLKRESEENRKTQRVILSVLDDLEANKTRLESENANLEALLESIGDGIIVTDRKGYIVRVNKAAEQLLGWTQKDLVGYPITKKVPIWDEEGKEIIDANRPVWDVIKNMKKISGIFRFKRKDGTAFPASLTIAPAFSSSGQVFGTVEAFRDMTKERELERIKNEFTSLASHQLRTPLSIASWYSEMLISGDVGTLNADQERYIKKVYDATRRMESLIAALLHLSRIESGTLVMKRGQVDILAVCRDALDGLDPLIVQKKLRVRVIGTKETPPLFADRGLLLFVFENLLSNAVKYTPEGGLITVRIGIVEDERKIVAQISDTGYGIPQESQPFVFTKFFRADNIKEKIPDGTGLGLYLVKSIVALSGGDVRLESRENKGTTFYVTLPLGSKKTSETFEAVKPQEG